MKFGAFSLMPWPAGRSPEPVHANELEQLTRAESEGYDTAWLAEHPNSRYGIGPSIHLTAAQLAAQTSRIRIGTSVTIPPFFHPLRLAEEIAMLDIMSGGRFDWAVAPGGPGQESAGFEAETGKSHGIFSEQLDVIRKAWTGERFSHDGDFYQIPELECLPTPVQEPAPPIWIAALSPATQEWAAKNDYPVLSDPFSPLDRIERNRSVYLDAARAAGVDASGYALPVLRHVYVGETMAKACEEAGPALLSCYRALTSVGAPGGADGETPHPDREPESFLRFLFGNCTIVGDAAFCRDKIGEMQERFGLDYLIAWQSFGDLPHAASLASQRRLIEKVAPAFA